MTKLNASNFKRLTGVWKTSGKVFVDNKTFTMQGTDSYESILDGNFILHKADVTMGNERSETFEIIELDSSTSEVKMNFFNSKGESGLMTGRMNDDDFLIFGDKIKFEGKINPENTEVLGKWFLQAEDKNWNTYIELKLEKQN